MYGEHRYRQMARKKFAIISCIFGFIAKTWRILSMSSSYTSGRSYRVEVQTLSVAFVSDTDGCSTSDASDKALSIHPPENFLRSFNGRGFTVWRRYQGNLPLAIVLHQHHLAPLLRPMTSGSMNLNHCSHKWLIFSTWTSSFNLPWFPNH